MTLLQMSGAGALMILTVAALRFCGGRRLPAGLFPWLWLVVCARLLVPFSLPSRFSAFTGLGTAVQAGAPAPGTVARRASAFLPMGIPAQPAVQAPAPEASPWLYIWLAGCLLVAGYFLFVYLRCRRAFACSVPANSPAVALWLAQHQLRRRVEVRVYPGIDTPLAYGLLRPVILLPGQEAIATGEQLHCVLSHELEHIKAFDELKKLLFAACVCVHWFNPLVWAMYLLAGRDIELACDARVLRRHSAKKPYALTLLGLAAQKQHPTPVYNGFSRYAIKERIKAIMNYKKVSAFAILLSCLLLVGVFTAFATSAANTPDADPAPTTTLASLPNGLAEKYAPLAPLVLEGYRDMSITAFREEINSLLDAAPESMHLLDEMHELEEYAPVNFEANYLLHTMLPLAAERWNPGTLGGIAIHSSGSPGGGLIEYSLRYTIKAPDTLTVGEYLGALSGHATAIEEHLNSLSPEELAEDNTDSVTAALPGVLEAIDSAHSGPGITIHTESFAYLPSDGSEETEPLAEDEGGDSIPPATAEDYAFVLSAMEGYETQTVAQQRDALWDMFNEKEDGDAIWQRIMFDTEPAVPLTPGQAAFLQISFPAALAANVQENRNYWAGTEDPPSLQFFDVLNTQTQTIRGEEYEVYQVFLDYDFTYKIDNEDTLLASERDAALSGVVNGITGLVAGMSEAQLADDTQATRLAYAEAERLASLHSDGNLHITITGLRIQTWDDRMEPEQ